MGTPAGWLRFNSIVAAMLSGLEEFFGLAFWQQLLATFIGVLIGIPAALWVSRRQERRDSDAAKRARDDRRRQLLSALRRELEFNRDQLRMIAQAINDGKIEAARVSTSLHEATTALKYELLPLPLCDALDILAYLLQTVDGFQKMRISLLFDPLAHSFIWDDTQRTFFGEHNPRLVAHLKDSTAKALAQIEKALPQLEYPTRATA